MAVDKQVTLATRLYRKTMAGELDWKISPREDWYQVSFSQYSIRIGTVQTARAEDVVIELVNNIGDVADSFSDEDLQRAGPRPTEDDHWYAPMNAMYQRARRTALGADKAIDDILNELDPF